MNTINPGDLVVARAADGSERERRAVTGVTDGLDFPVVWVCSPEEWGATSSNGQTPQGMPWPAEDVQLVEAGRVEA